MPHIPTQQTDLNIQTKMESQQDKKSWAGTHLLLLAALRADMKERCWCVVLMSLHCGGCDCGWVCD